MEGHAKNDRPSASVLSQEKLKFELRKSKSSDDGSPMPLALTTIPDELGTFAQQTHASKSRAKGQASEVGVFFVSETGGA